MIASRAQSWGAILDLSVDSLPHCLINSSVNLDEKMIEEGESPKVFTVVVFIVKVLFSS